MDTVTYPTPAVEDTIEAHFVPLKIDIAAPAPEFRQLLSYPRPQWGPTFIFLDPKGIELRRWTGWLAPGDFVAELSFVRAMQRMVRRDFAAAYEQFRKTADELSESEVAPEALFWAAAALYRRENRNVDALAGELRELIERYPGSVWAKRANILDMI
jgi:hypothetical protein